MIITDDVVTRFWEKVDKRGPDDCWEWAGGTKGVEYGRIVVAGRTERAHRLSYELHIGPIPPGLYVCHRCDNPPCCNPAHLFSGTQSDNINDMFRKGREGRRRYSKGMKHGRAKLTDDQVIEIRKRYVPQRYPFSRLAKEYSVTPKTIRNITQHKTWTHI